MCASASQKRRKQDKGIISESKGRVRKNESEEEHSGVQCYDKSDEKPVHVDVDKEMTGSSGKGPTLALILSKSEEDEINHISELELGMIVRIVISVFGDLKENLDRWIGWVVYHITESKISSSFLFSELTWKEPPRARQMTMEEIDSDYDPMDDKRNLRGGECYTVNSTIEIEN